QDQVVEIPNPTAAECEDHRDRGARFVNVEAMQSENAAKEGQQHRHAARALGDGLLLRRLVGVGGIVFVVSVAKRHDRYYRGLSDGASKCRSAGSTSRKENLKPDAMRRAGNTRCPLCTIAAPSVPKTIRSASAGTGTTAGRPSTFPNVL